MALNGGLYLRRADIDNTGAVGVSLRSINAGGVAVNAGGNGVENGNVGDAELGIDIVCGAVGWDELGINGVRGTLELNCDVKRSAVLNWRGSQAGSGQESSDGESEELHGDDCGLRI